MKPYTYVIERRSKEVGGGWQLRLYKAGVEVEVTIFPLSNYAITARNPEEAVSFAYEDAWAVGAMWVATRGYTE